MAHYNDLSVDGTSDKIVTSAGFNEVGANGMVSTEIADSAVVNEAALNKMATSIPTPFARLYLYDTAFNELNALEHANKGHGYKIEPANATLYHHLVSECFDLLEFIHEYGSDPRFTIHEWDVKTDTSLLGATDNQGVQIIDDENYGDQQKITNEIADKHKRLATALRDAVLNTSLSTISKIYIFKWDNEIVGGTSPFTLVYTSPNWRRKMNAMKLRFYGSLGNLLFPPIDPTTKVKSLTERSADFRVYMFALAQKYANQFTSQSGPLKNLNQYIVNTINNYETQGAAITKALSEYKAMVNDLDNQFEARFKPLKDTSTEGNSNERPLIADAVQAGGIRFFTKVMVADKESAYIIQPTVDKLPVEKNKNRQDIEIANQLPLVLSTSKLGNNAKYWYKTPYDPATLPALPEGEYYERVLPGVAGNPQYPYLTESDFFEDSIMWLGYVIDKKRYATCFDGDCGFLLPLKPNFFKFFSVKDLPKMVRVIPEPFPFCPKVTVTIDIPVKGGTIRFSKTYDRNKGQYVDFPQDGSFKLGIFPFYTYAGTAAADEDAYKVLLARMCDIDLKFYNNDFVTPLDNDVVKSRVRTEDGRNKTEYYTIGTHMGEDDDKAGTFTAIRVVKNGVGGMIVPKFAQAKVSDDKYVFCVDFGTANTNVAYAKTIPYRTSSGNMEPRVTHDNIKTLEYDAGGYQMAMLNEEGADGKAGDLNKYIDSEFVPKAIGKGEVKFPTRTIACTRSGNIDGTPQLFGDANIAFHTDKYGNIEGYRYQTELKWGQASRKLNGAFFRELLWLCKNKVAELGGNPVFDFYFTYPQTMSGISTMMRGWADAAKAIRTRANVFNVNVRAANGRRLHIYEGIAPWYRAISIPGADIFHNEDFLNIDIGGGSTDAIYITRPIGNGTGREMQGYSFSAKFAANDLWGDGVGGDDDKTNGFLKFFEGLVLPGLNEEDKQEYEKYKTQATGSSDIISYLFSHPKKYDFAEHLASDYKLRVPLLLHFAATIYYVARTIAIQQLALPKHISFSGMGSLYLKYLTDDTEILSEIIKAIFNFAGLKTVDREGKEKSLTARFTANPKKITAEGGLLMFNTTRPGLSDKVVKSEELNFHLYDGEEEEEETVDMLVKDLPAYKDKTVAEVEKFLKIFEYTPFRQAVSHLEGEYPRFDMDRLKSYVSEGYNLARDYEYPSAQEDSPVKDVLFFWPLKHAIYMLGRDMADQSIATNGGQNNQ